MCAALIASSFLRSKRAGLGLTRRMSKASAISAIVKTSRSSAIAPAEQGQVVEHALGQEAAARRTRAGRSRRSRLESRLLPSPITIGRWPKRGAPVPMPIAVERLVERDLARRRGQQVLAAQHVGDPHQRVVDRVDQRVERVAVGAHQREVGHVLGLEGDLAADQVVEGDRAVGHPEPQHRRAALGLERRDAARR